MKHHKSLARLTAIMLAITLTAALFTQTAPSITASTYVNMEESKEGTEKPSKKSADNAAKDVLSRITVPKEYRKFTWDGVIKSGTAYYEFTWSDKSHTITVDYYDGFIYAYNHSNFYTDYPTFAKMSLAEQEKCAREHIYRLNPDIEGDIILTREDPDYSIDSTVQYSISRRAQGIDVISNDGYITIDRETGELIDMTLDWWLCADGADFPDASKRLTGQEICSLFAGSSTVSQPEYRIYYDTEYTSGIKIFHPYALPIYEIKNSETELDAFTGKETAYYTDKESLSSVMPYSWRGYWFDMCGGLVEEDNPDYINAAAKEAFDKSVEEKVPLTSEQALEIIKAEKYIAFDSNMILTETIPDYERDENMNVRYTLTFCYDSSPRDDNKHDLKVRLDGYTGEILMICKDYDSESAATPMEEKAAVSAAKKAASHFLGKKASEYRYEGNPTDNETDAAVREETGKSRVRLTRYINGIPAPFDTVRVTVSPEGEVLRFSYDYHNIEITPGKPMTEEETWEKLFEASPPKLYFRGFTSPDGKTHVYLNYEFDSEYYINAFTGERCTEYGYSYYPDDSEKKPVAYTDIKGHKYEKEIAALRQYGVYLPDSGDTCRPDDPITIAEFTRLCSRAQLAYGIYSGDIYPRIETTDPETGETSYKDDPRVNSPLTYGELARIFVIHYRDSGHNPDPNANYRQPYKNVTRDDPNYGYIAIAKKKGYISSGSEFDSERVLTRGECMKYAYDYIESSSGYKPLYEIFKI